MTKEEITQIIDLAGRRSATDPEFRALAVRDAQAAAAVVLGRPIPGPVNVRFWDNTGNQKYFVLPNALETSGELSDEELETVAGGCIAGSCCGTNACCVSGCIGTS